MDVVLDLYETFIGDHIFALLHPAQVTAHDAISAQGGGEWTPNPSSGQAIRCDYQPATKYFSVTPSPALCMSAWPRENIYRQGINLFLMFWTFGLVVYFVFSSLSFVFVYDKQMMRHPKYLKDQVSLEIKQACSAMPGIAFLSVPLVLLGVRGHSKMYDTTDDGPGLWYDILQFPLFILFTDSCTYWIHRALHQSFIYKNVHKCHHRFIIPTPYASLAFHPLEGFAMSLPYHIFGFIFPFQKLAYLFFFMFINIWILFVHDGEYLISNPVINGAACHTIHHHYFNFNYGQYTTLWDRLCGSYRKPPDELFQKRQARKASEWKKQTEDKTEDLDCTVRSTNAGKGV
ncbi:Putative C-5 sterol desaturase [Hirsutella minnesotensis 3608]|uniref:Putative C-5 sterol desaturase n=1 Tax=Hirsutella minnesotensis 3608 TaxID=1043627 RepID=A0A0F7ZP97_9HYPO|nr:Putative C-5 sterol desaturase [Hirsutella minnesotensis 3608]